MDQAKIEALKAQAASEGGISPQDSQELFDHHRDEGLANTIPLLQQAYEAAWHHPEAQVAIREILQRLLFEQAQRARKQA